MEELEPDGESKRNPQEGELVLRQVNELCRAGVKPADIAIIAPYAAQVRWLRQNSEFDQIEIDTVDGFQAARRKRL